MGGFLASYLPTKLVREKISLHVLNRQPLHLKMGTSSLSPNYYMIYQNVIVHHTHAHGQAIDFVLKLTNSTYLDDMS